MKVLHTNAHEFTCESTNYKGEHQISTNYIALMPGVNIHELIRKWNLRGGTRYIYKYCKELDLQMAMTAKSITGRTIMNDWKFLDTLNYHSVVMEVKKLD